MTDLVSIVIPTYNRATLLARAIDSACLQTHTKIEILVVDDGSTDHTETVVRSRYGTDPRVRYFRQENQGVAGARNSALAASRGDFIAFLNSDDIWRPWKLELQLACLQRAPQIGMVWTDMRALRPDGTTLADVYLRTMYRSWRQFHADSLFVATQPITDLVPGLPEAASRMCYLGDIYAAMALGNLVHTSTVMLRRERLDRVGKFNEALTHAGEDYDFHLRTCREGPVGFADVATIDYQTGMPDQLTRHKDALAINFVRTLERTLQKDHDKIVQPLRLITSVRAEAHAWAAETLIDIGERRAASAYLLRSLAFKAWQPRLWAQLILCHLPAALDQRIRCLYYATKARAGRAP